MRQENRIEEIKKTIAGVQARIKRVEAAIDTVKEDPYYNLIIMKYFQGKSREEIADFFQCDGKTVNRNKNRLIAKIEMSLFSEEYLDTMLSWLNVV